MRPSRARSAIASAVALAAVALLASCEPVGGTVLGSGQTLASGATLRSPDGKIALTVQVDGNVVLRDPNRKVLWSTGTTDRAGARLVMRTSGSLALLTPANAVAWSTPTGSAAGAHAELGDDANLVIYATAGQPLWASGSSTYSSKRVAASTLTTSTQMRTLMKMYEGYVGDHPYYDANGNCTVGYGHLIRLGTCTSADKEATYDVDALFDADVVAHEKRLKSSLGSVPMNQHEFDALSDYTFGRGSLTAATAPNLYAAMTDDPPRYADVPGIFEAAGDASIKGLCNRYYDRAEIFAGGRYDKTSHC
jgi:GH24 family phage-related lysozyme (muramidase)